jgi:hypothetical protein
MLRTNNASIRELAKDYAFQEEPRMHIICSFFSTIDAIRLEYLKVVETCASHFIKLIRPRKSFTFQPVAISGIGISVSQIAENETLTLDQIYFLSGGRYFCFGTFAKH